MTPYREMLRKMMVIELEWFWKKSAFAAFGFLMFFIGYLCGYWLQGCICS